MMHLQAKKLIPFLALIICLPLFVSQCNRKDPVIFNFGDSNSDTGGYAAATGSEIGYPYGRTFFRLPTGRLSDGRLVIDFLCEYLGTHNLSPYLDPFETDFTNGVNFAIHGSKTLPRSQLFNLGVQIQQFKRFYKRSIINLHSKGTTTHLVFSEQDFRNALYTLDIGQNDLTLAFSSLSYSQVLHKIPSFISQIRDAMWAIYRLGGKNFWVHNTGPSGCLPLQLATWSRGNGSDFDSYGCINSINEGAKAFNAKLYSLCQELRSQMENSTIVYVDVYSIKYDLIANSSYYGFENRLMACCGYGGGPYNCDPSAICSLGKSTVCDEGTQYISWDGTHYSEAANAVVASKILSTRYSSPPFEFDFFCNNSSAMVSSS